MNMNSGIVLSQTDGRPLYQQLIDRIKRKIALGDWSPGDLIPSIRALAIELGISVITVKRAYLELEHQNIIHTQQGIGSFVSQDPQLGSQLNRTELGDHIKKAVQLAETLGLDEDELIKLIKEHSHKWSKT